MLTCLGLAVFLAVGQPEGGQASPINDHWLSVGAAFGTIVVILVVLAQRGSPGRRAAFCASAAAVMWALVAMLTGRVQCPKPGQPDGTTAHPPFEDAGGRVGHFRSA